MIKGLNKSNRNAKYIIKLCRVQAIVARGSIASTAQHHVMVY